MSELLLAGVILAHSWYPTFCCSEQDCRPVPCAEISYRTENRIEFVYYRGLRGVAWAVYPSPDGLCHVCQSSIALRCVFIPEGVS